MSKLVGFVILLSSAHLLALESTISEPISDYRISAGAVANTAAVFPMIQIQERVWPSVALGLMAIFSSAKEENISASVFALLATTTLLLENHSDGWNIVVAAGMGHFGTSFIQESYSIIENRLVFSALTALGYRVALGSSAYVAMNAGVMYLTPPDSVLVEVKYASLKPMSSLELGFKF